MEKVVPAICYIESDEFKKKLLEANAGVANLDRKFKIVLHLMDSSINPYYVLQLHRGDRHMWSYSVNELDKIVIYAMAWYYGYNSGGFDKTIEVMNLPWYKRLFQQF